jgi:N6-adenosine-specific RNA methylase IME4
LLSYPVFFGITFSSGLDPAWKYKQKGLQGAAEKHYKTMNLDDICALPVGKIAADDSVLFLWATFPLLSEALRVISAWGFTFKTVAFVWLKKNKKADSFFYGLGFWTRGNAELCLIATRGHPKRISKSVRQLVISPLERHSKKPDCVRDRIVELIGDVPRIELFAREITPGWDALGNEIDGRDIRDALREVIGA